MKFQKARASLMEDTEDNYFVDDLEEKTTVDKSMDKMLALRISGMVDVLAEKLLTSGLTEGSAGKWVGDSFLDFQESLINHI